MDSEAAASAAETAPTKQSTLESTEATVESENVKDAGSAADAESTSTVDGVVEEAIVVTIPTTAPITRATGVDNATPPVAVNTISVTSDVNVSSDVDEPKLMTLLSKFFGELPSIIERAEHKEMWGVTLSNESHVPSCIVLEKFLRANNKNIDKAKAHLIEALKWRKHMNPLKLLSEVEFSRAKFGNLGYVTKYERNDGKSKEIITWNIYGGVKDLKTTFGDIEEYVRCPSKDIDSHNILY
jgi:phosphatidylinositol transfer protein SFH5